MGVRFRLARALGRIEGEEKLPALLALAGTVDVDGWLARFAASAADVAPAFLPHWGRRIRLGSAQCRRNSQHSSNWVKSACAGIKRTRSASYWI